MGLNRFVIHTSVHQPLLDKGPGLSLGPFGQWFTRNETWAEPARAWVTYLARSSFLLQQGRFVADVLYYYGEDTNVTALFGAKAPPVPGEQALGWAVYYATGIAFAGLLVTLYGPGWLAAPRLGPALAVGVGTVLAPLFVLQPAMGAGIASRKTATPLRNCVRSLLNHTAFGAGLYLAAQGMRWALR